MATFDHPFFPSDRHLETKNWLQLIKTVASQTCMVSGWYLKYRVWMVTTPWPHLPILFFPLDRCLKMNNWPGCPRMFKNLCFGVSLMWHPWLIWLLLLPVSNLYGWWPTPWQNLPIPSSPEYTSWDEQFARIAQECARTAALPVLTMHCYG